MKEPMTTIQVTNSEAEPNVWSWNIWRGEQALLSGGPETTEPKTYGDPQAAVDGAVRAYVRIVQTPYQESGG